MKLNNSVIQNAITGLLICCAIVTTVAVAWQALNMPTSSESMQEPRYLADWQYLIAQRTPTLGNADAKIKIIKFSDYQCPYCRQIEPVLKTLYKKHSGDIAIFHYDFPLTRIHPRAHIAAIAAKCAGLQNAQPAYQSLLYTSDIQHANWLDIAKKANVPNLVEFGECVSNKVTDAEVKSDIALGKKTGVRAEVLESILNTATG